MAQESAYVKTPTSGNQDEGFAPGSQPPAGWFNWLWVQLYYWNHYFANGPCGTDVDITPADGYGDVTSNLPRISDVQGAVGSKLGATSGWNVPFKFPEGTIINAVNVKVLEPDVVGEVFTLRLFEVQSSGALNQIGDTITSGFSGTFATLIWDDTTNDSTGEIPHLMTTDSRFLLQILFAATTANDEAQVTNIKVTRE